MSHARQEIHQCGIRFFVMKQEVVLADLSIGEIDHLHRKTIEPNPFVSVLSKDHRLAMLEFDRGVVASGFVLGIAERSIIEHVAVLIDLDKARTAMVRRSLENCSEVFDVAVNGTGDERRLGANCHTDRIQRVIDHPHGGTLGDLPLDARRRVLPLGQTVDSVIEQHDIQIDVSAEQVNEVVAADAECIAVARDDPDTQVWSRQLQPCCYRRRATVDGVDSVRVDVVGKATAATDPRNENRLLGADADLGQHLFHLGENRVIAASGAPTNVLVAGKIVWLQEWKGCAHNGIKEVMDRRYCSLNELGTRYRFVRAADSLDGLVATSRILSTSSVTVNGLPLTLLKPMASTR
jgi:hypothetical protein